MSFAMEDRPKRWLRGRLSVVQAALLKSSLTTSTVCSCLTAPTMTTLAFLVASKRFPVGGSGLPSVGRTALLSYRAVRASLSPERQRSAATLRPGIRYTPPSKSDHAIHVMDCNFGHPCPAFGGRRHGQSHGSFLARSIVRPPRYPHPSVAASRLSDRRLRSQVRYGRRSMARSFLASLPSHAD